MESVVERAVRVHILLVPCGFCNESNIVLRDIFTLGLKNSSKNVSLKKNGMEKNITMAKLIDIVLAEEMPSKMLSETIKSEINFVKGNKFNQRKFTKRIINQHSSNNNYKTYKTCETNKQIC